MAKYDRETVICKMGSGFRVNLKLFHVYQKILLLKENKLHVYHY